MRRRTFLASALALPAMRASRAAPDDRLLTQAVREPRARCKIPVASLQPQVVRVATHPRDHQRVIGRDVVGEAALELRRRWLIVFPAHAQIDSKLMRHLPF